MNRAPPSRWTDAEVDALRPFVHAPIKADLLRELARQWGRPPAAIQTRLQKLRVEAGVRLHAPRPAPPPKHTPWIVRRPCIGSRCGGQRCFEYDRAIDGPRFQCDGCSRVSPSPYAPGGMGSVGQQINARRYS